DLAPAGGGDALIERRAVWFDEWIETPILDREKLAASTRFDGPAIVEEAGGTTVVPPGWSVTVDESGALLCRADAPA
ncbi:MAG: hydantoinase/oxoprolinase family protein, partial [Gammaproteobacteria bacterium]|nr:hydantoinase/oxoprolinase family protein [Gammaproteobacteria bacterium]